MPTTNDWAQQQWGNAELGDKRRTHRAVRLGAQIANHPQDSLPGQTQSWGDLKAAYRLLHEEDITHAALSVPHWRQTREHAERAKGTVLFIQDGSHLDFTFRDIHGLGRIGNNAGQGLLIHSTLALLPGSSATTLGVAHQLVWVRDAIAYKPQESRVQRYRRQARESDHWFSALEAIGRVPEHAHWVSVGDRESDIFHYWRQARALGWECLLRLAQDRRIILDNGALDYVKQWAAQLVPRAHESLSLRVRPERVARHAKLSMAWGHVHILPPRNDPGSRELAPISAWVLRVWEVTPPVGEPPLEWLLLSTSPIDTAAQARERVAWYRHRWLIEQYHKALKTGCRMEQSQLHDGQALMRLLGFLSIVAVRLLQVQSLARSAPDLPASRTVDIQLLEFLCHLRQINLVDMTVHRFWREVARLGGFLARRHDGEPGWQTLWKGWNYLYPRFEGYLIGKQCG